MKESKENIINAFESLPIERKISATLLSSRYVCIWFTNDGQIMVSHLGLSVGEMALVNKIVDIKINEMILPREKRS